MSQSTRRLRAFDNGHEHIGHKSFEIHFDYHERVIHTDLNERYELLMQGETPPPAEMYLRSIHNVYIVVTTAGTSRRLQVSAVSSDLPACNLEALDEVIKLLTNYRKEHENEDTQSNGT